MEITFLEADVPLVKSFSLINNQIQKTAYPHTFKFTSHTVEIRTLRQLHKTLLKHAELGHCLLKGDLQRPLINESRKGSTDASTPTTLLCLDIDGLPGILSADDFISLLPDEFHDVGYIVQYSASQGIIDKGFCAHVFFILHTPVTPGVLKQWFTRLNLDIPLLQENLRLSRTYNAIKWPLDITVGQNDKLLYIAPPTVGKGIRDPFANKERIQLVSKKNSTVRFNFNSFDPGALRRDTLTALNALRKAQGLQSKRQINERPYKDTVVATATDQPEITGIKSERGFTYLNLNGGDSWGYYHPDNNADIIYNFKGEPNYTGRELLPAYYAETRVAAREAKKAPKNPETAEAGYDYFAFIERNTDCYYRGKWNEETEHLELIETTKRAHVTDYLKQHGQPLPDFLPLWTVEFAFDDPYRIDFGARSVNLFKPSPLLLTQKNADRPPPTIRRVIFHALGNHQPSYNAFINWLACIFQKRIKTGVAWVLHGTQGTGKGIIFNHILSPILGHIHTPRVSMETLASENFNAFLEQAVFCLIDEAQVSEVNNSKRLAGKLKEYITEPTLMIRKMRTNGYKARNFTNFIIASNENDPVLINSDDRRYSVAARQEKKLQITKKEIDGIEAELEDFVAFLNNIVVDEAAATTPFDSFERQRVQALSRDSNEEVAHAIRSGDFDFFFDNKPDLDLPNELTERSRRVLPTYAECLDRLYESIGKKNICRDVMQTLVYYTTGNTFITPNKFTKFLGHKGIQIQSVRFNSEAVRGAVTEEWTISPEIKKEYLKWRTTRQAPVHPVQDKTKTRQ